MATYGNDLGNLIIPGSYEIFKKALGDVQQVEWTMLVQERSTVRAQEYFDTVGNLSPAEAKAEGDAITYDKFQYNFRTTLTPTTKAKGVSASVEAFEDDLYGVMDKVFGGELVKKMILAKEQEVAAAYNGAFAAIGGDGFAILSASHTLKNSVLVNDNLATGALSFDNIVAAKNKFNHIYDQAGQLFDTYPTHIVIHPDKFYILASILESVLKPFELSNTKNTVESKYALQIIQNRRIDMNTSTGVSKWFLLDKTIQGAGCIHLKRQGMKMSSYQDDTTKDYRADVYERYITQFVAPGYGIVGSLGS